MEMLMGANSNGTKSHPTTGKFSSCLMLRTESRMLKQILPEGYSIITNVIITKDTSYEPPKIS